MKFFPKVDSKASKLRFAENSYQSKCLFLETQECTTCTHDFVGIDG